MDAARYWFQEAILEEGLTLAESRSASSLLSSYRERGKLAQELSDQLELLASTSVRYWKQAERAKPRLHVPSTVPANEPLPLVVCLHPDRLSPAFWDETFCVQVANQLKVAVLVLAGTEHYGPERYHWSGEFELQYEPDHAVIEKAVNEFAGKFQEKPGSRLLIGLHETFSLVLAVTGKHHEKYAGGVLIHPVSIGSTNDQSRAFMRAAAEQAEVKQRFLVLYEPEQYRENLANFIATTLAPTARQVELKEDEDASFEYAKQITSESELAPKILEAIRRVLSTR